MPGHVTGRKRGDGNQVCLAPSLPAPDFSFGLNERSFILQGLRMLDHVIHKQGSSAGLGLMHSIYSINIK